MSFSPGIDLSFRSATREGICFYFQRHFDQAHRASGETRIRLLHLPLG